MLTDEQTTLAKAAFQKSKLAYDSAPNTQAAFVLAYERLLPVIVKLEQIIEHFDHDADCSMLVTRVNADCDCALKRMKEECHQVKREAGLPC